MNAPDAVDVSLHKVAAHAHACRERAFEIHRVANLEIPPTSCACMSPARTARREAFGVVRNDCQTCAVHGDAVAFAHAVEHRLREDRDVWSRAAEIAPTSSMIPVNIASRMPPIKMSSPIVLAVMRSS